MDENNPIHSENDTKKIAIAFEKLGISIKNTGDSFKSTVEILNELSKAWGNYSPRKQKKIARLLAGIGVKDRIMQFFRNVRYRWITGKK